MVPKTPTNQMVDLIDPHHQITHDSGHGTHADHRPLMVMMGQTQRLISHSFGVATFNGKFDFHCGKSVTWDSMCSFSYTMLKRVCVTVILWWPQIFDVLEDYLSPVTPIQGLQPSKPAFEGLLCHNTAQRPVPTHYNLKDAPNPPFQ